MAKVAFVLADDFEDSEFRVPFDAVTGAGHQATVVGAGAGAKVTGKKHQESVEIGMAATDARAADFDALVIPGGYSPDKLRMQAEIVRFVRDMVAMNKPVAAICHGPSLLVEADVLRGRTLTSWPSIRKDLENAGASWVDRPVVEDGTLITSRKPADLEPFSASLLKRL